MCDARRCSAAELVRFGYELLGLVVQGVDVGTRGVYDENMGDPVVPLTPPARNPIALDKHGV